MCCRSTSRPPNPLVRQQIAAARIESSRTEPTQKKKEGPKKAPIHPFARSLEGSADVREGRVEEDRLGDDPTKGQHGEAAVLELLVPQELDLLLGLALEVPGPKVKVPGFPAGSLE